MKTIRRRNQNGDDRDEKHKEKRSGMLIWTGSVDWKQPRKGISNLKDMSTEITQTEKESSKCREIIPGTQEPWNNIKLSIFTIGMPVWRKEKNGEEIFEEITVDNVQN